MPGAQVLTREQLKTVFGGAQYYRCSCNGMAGTWYYTSGSAPAQSTLDADINSYCNNGATCGWTQGNWDPASGN